MMLLRAAIQVIAAGFVVASSYVFGGNGMSEAFQAEIMARLKSSRSATTDASDIIVKYVPLGTQQKDAMESLSKLGFTVYEVKPGHFDSKAYDSAVVGIIEPGSSGLSREIRTGLDFKGGVLRQIDGKIVLRLP